MPLPESTPPKRRGTAVRWPTDQSANPTVAMVAAQTTDGKPSDQICSSPSSAAEPAGAIAADPDTRCDRDLLRVENQHQIAIGWR